MVFSEDERQIYELYRRPLRGEFPWRSCALLVVDVTYAFLGGKVPTLEAARSLRTACGLPAWQALGPMSDLIDASRAVGRPVIYTRAYPEGAVGGATIGAAEDGEWNRIAEEIAPEAGDLIIEKARASAFFGTPLSSYLVRSGIQGLVVVGGSTSGCVRASVLDGSSAGFAMAIAHDGCFDRSQLSHAVALQELDAKYARVLSTHEAVGALTAARGPSDRSTD
jgi:nicotinamidase-related amidase